MGKHVVKIYFNEQGQLIIKPYRIADLAVIYDVNRKTMCKWMERFPEELKAREGKYFSVQQVRFIVDKFGLPTYGITEPTINPL